MTRDAQVPIEVSYQNHETGELESTTFPAEQLDKSDGTLCISFTPGEMERPRFIPTNQRAKWSADSETVHGTVRWFHVEHGVCALHVEVSP